MQNFLFDLYYRVKYGIKIYRNVLTEEERLTLLEESKKHLTVISEGHPGLQTPADLHQKIKYEGYLIICKLLNKIKFKSISKCWMNYADHELGHICWHTHPTVLTSIFYIENPEGKGTLFRRNGREFQIDIPTNSLMIIPGGIEHTAPYTKLNKPRYSFVLDTNE